MGTKQVQSAVTLYCAGSVDKVKGFSLDVQVRTVAGELPAPGGLAVGPGNGAGEVVATWPRGAANHGFLVQYATDPANAATVSVPQARTGTKFTVTGIPVSGSVSVRIAAIDPASPNGQTPWSAWVMSNVG